MRTQQKYITTTQPQTGEEFDRLQELSQILPTVKDIKWLFDIVWQRRWFLTLANKGF